MGLLITILAYILALIASAMANVVGFWFFLPLTYFAAKTDDGATELRLRILRQFLGSVAAFPLALAAACVVLSLFGIRYGWLIFVLVAVHILSDVFSAKVFPLSQQAGAAISIIVTGVVYFGYFLNG